MFTSPLDRGSEFAAVSFDFCLLRGSEAYVSAESLIFQVSDDSPTRPCSGTPSTVMQDSQDYALIRNIVDHTTFGVRAVPDRPTRTQPRTSGQGQEIESELILRRYVSVRTRIPCSPKAERPSYTFHTFQSLCTARWAEHKRAACVIPFRVAQTRTSVWLSSGMRFALPILLSSGDRYHGFDRVAHLPVLAGLHTLHKGITSAPLDLAWPRPRQTEGTVGRRFRVIVALRWFISTVRSWCEQRTKLTGSRPGRSRRRTAEPEHDPPQVSPYTAVPSLCVRAFKTEQYLLQVLECRRTSTAADFISRRSSTRHSSIMNTSSPPRSP